VVYTVAEQQVWYLSSDFHEKPPISNFAEISAEMIQMGTKKNGRTRDAANRHSSPLCEDALKMI
jgi:hypothetical protein